MTKWQENDPRESVNKSATIAMENAMTDFPGSPYQETLQFLIIDSHFQYAKLSTARRKLERYNDAIQAFHTFASRFPESTYLPEAQGLFDQSVKAVTDLNLEDTNSSANR